MFSLVLLLASLGRASCDHWYSFKTGRNLIAPIGSPFGFTPGGHFDLNVRDFALSDMKKNGATDRISQVEAAFLLKRFDNEASFTNFIEGVQSNRSCVFEYDVDDGPWSSNEDAESRGSIDSADNGILLSMRSDTRKISYNFKSGEDGLYFLIYQVCPPEPLIRSSFKLDLHRYNFDRFGSKSYLSAGEMNLPMMFVFFSVSYLICLFVWSTNLRQIQNGGTGMFIKNRNGRPTIYAIHHFMTVLLLLKFLCVFTESIRYHYIRIYGHAAGWTFIYYAISFFKGMFLFTVILLIGSGWSFVKPYLNTREKYVILVVLILQVISNLAILFLTREISGETGYAKWTALLHLVDIICCCIVLVPLVWQVNELEKGIGEEDDDEEIASNEPEAGEKGEILEKLRLFRSFYLIVVAYIYATRILIYLFSTVLDYQHIWLQHFVIELVTLTFYVVVGFMFHPKPENVYTYQSLTKDVTGNGGETELVGSRTD